MLIINNLFLKKGFIPPLYGGVCFRSDFELLPKLMIIARRNQVVLMCIIIALFINKLEYFHSHENYSRGEE